MSKFTYLESPMTIRGKVYRNRLIAAPTLFAHSVFFLPEIAENVYRMVENRAKGGFAAVSTGELPVNNEEGTTLFMERAIDMDYYDGDDFKKVKEYADRIRKHGALAYLEFSHEGAVAETKAPYVPWGPDAYVREDGVKVYALNLGMQKPAGLTASWFTEGMDLTSSSLFHPGPTTGPMNSAEVWKTVPGFRK